MTITYSDRAAFVLNEYRYAISNDTTVQGQTSTASDIEVDTNSDMAGAAQLAAEFLGDLKRSTATHEIILDDIVVTADDCDGSPPMFQVTLPGYAGLVGRASQIVIDPNSWTTTVTVRG